MNRDASYRGIDYFRLFAAFLIIAIHTSPLLSCSEIAEFILSRVIARVGVPFFFMTSGFFLISRYTRDNKKLAGFIKKTVLIYGAAILIYIPLNIYNDYFKMEMLAPNIIKDLVFDGTFYHLWYLPAAAVGAFIAWHAVKSGYKRALAITGVLYIIGLFGDSYYGISEKIPIVNAFYNLMFQIFDYTRNGIFFAPFFFVLGSAVREQAFIPLLSSLCPERENFGKNIFAFSMSLILMFAEAILLHNYDLCRHDSMYIFLPVCMYFLFNALLCWRGKRSVFIKNASLLIYIIHPAVIVAVRIFARLSGLWKLLVENSLVHYIAVSIVSAALSFGAVFLWQKYKQHYKRKIKALNPIAGRTSRAWIEINLKNLEHNVAVLKNAMHPESEIMAVIKARAYGHGDFEIASHLNRIGIKTFAVATIEEGIELREYGICGEILILGYTAPCMAGYLKKYDLTQTIIDYSYGRELNRQRIEVKCHIKIDTGMHRLGVPYDGIMEVKKLCAMKYLNIEGIYTHLCCADNRNPEYVEFTRQQIDRFYDMADMLKEGVFKNGIPKLHIQSSYGLLNYPELKCDYVRIGIALYGVLSSNEWDTRQKLMLRPVLSLKSRVILIRRVNEGESLGYNRDFIAERDTMAAILPIGYGDGFPRNLSCKRSGVMIHGEFAPIIGRICMDQLAVDITDLEDVCIGDTAVLIGEEGPEINAAAVSENSGSISNELLCRMGTRLPVVEKR